MAYKKQSIPKAVQNAQKRLDGMVSIDEDLDLGNGVSVTTVRAAIKKVTDDISNYNTTLSQLDEMGNEIEQDTKMLNELNSRALKGIEFKYGKNSNEYEKAGGTRTVDRKKTARKKDESGKGG